MKFKIQKYILLIAILIVIIPDFKNAPVTYEKNDDRDVPSDPISPPETSYTDYSQIYYDSASFYQYIAHRLPWVHIPQNPGWEPILVRGARYRYRTVDSGSNQVTVYIDSENSHYSKEDTPPEQSSFDWRYVYFNSTTYNFWNRDIHTMIPDDLTITLQSSNPSSRPLQINKEVDDDPGTAYGVTFNQTDFYLDYDYEFDIMTIHEQCQYLSIGDPKSGSFTTTDNIDYMYCDLDADQEYIFNLSRTAGAGNFDMAILHSDDLYSDQMDLLNNLSCTQSDVYPKIMSFTPTTTGTYCLFVVARRAFFDTGSYSVSLSEGDPIITDHTDNFTVQDGYTDQSISWTATDTHPDVYNINLKGYGNVAGPLEWTSGDPITYDLPDDLGVGSHIYTVNFTDDYNNYVTGSINFTVIDTNTPIITFSSVNFTEEDGYTGKSISWTATDHNPYNYTIHLKGFGKVAGSTAWTDGDPITYNLPEDLGVGSHIYTVNFTDESNNYITKSINFTVIDTTKPVIIANASELEVDEDYKGQVLSWTATDLNPYNYIIELLGSGIVVPLTPWENNTPVEYNIPKGFKPDVYIYNITFIDESGNCISNIVSVTINSIKDDSKSNDPPVVEEDPTLIVILIGIIAAVAITGLVIVRKSTNKLRERDAELESLKSQREQITEDDITISKEKHLCLVHKGPIEGYSYICPSCGAYYCAKCVEALKEAEMNAGHVVHP